jgi:hypothetical protein
MAKAHQEKIKIPDSAGRAIVHGLLFYSDVLV